MTTDNRPDPPSFGTERETLRGFLEYHRATLAMKCGGLTDAELRKQSMPPRPGIRAAIPWSCSRPASPTLAARSPP